MATKPSTDPFCKFITIDGSSGFKAEPNRYHLYVSLTCPFAHRTIIGRKIKGLEKIISMTVVDYIMPEQGWKFCNDKPKCEPDTVNGCVYLREIYQLALPGYDGPVSVPVLWDKQHKTIVNNDSGEILQMFSTEFDAFCETEEQKNLKLYPADLKKVIDEINDKIYTGINIGVYKAGFALEQVYLF